MVVYSGFSASGTNLPLILLGPDGNEGHARNSRQTQQRGGIGGRSVQILKVGGHERCPPFTGCPPGCVVNLDLLACHLCECTNPHEVVPFKPVDDGFSGNSSWDSAWSALSSRSLTWLILLDRLIHALSFSSIFQQTGLCCCYRWPKSVQSITKSQLKATSATSLK